MSYIRLFQRDTSLPNTTLNTPAGRNIFLVYYGMFGTNNMHKNALSITDLFIILIVQISVIFMIFFFVTIIIKY